MKLPINSKILLMKTYHHKITFIRTITNTLCLQK